jgi:hypothetical protein
MMMAMLGKVAPFVPGVTYRIIVFLVVLLLLNGTGLFKRDQSQNGVAVISHDVYTCGFIVCQRIN